MDYNDFEDDHIARAIALSLQEAKLSRPPPSPPPRRGSQQKPIEVIEIEDSDDDYDIEPDTNVVEDDEEAQFQAEIQRALEASKAESSTKATSTSTTRSGTTKSSYQPTPSPPEEPQSPIPQSPPAADIKPAINSFLSDRAQLEKERLARQKRLRPDIDNSNKDDCEDLEEEDEEMEHIAKRQRLSSSTVSSARHTNVASSSSRPVASSSRAGGSARPSEDTFFWNGELRQTANLHVDKDKDSRPTFRLSDIFAPRDEITFAIVSAYCVNLPWLYSMFNPQTPVVVVAHDPRGNETIKEVLPNWIKTTPLLRGGWGCMHMKFMLLFYKTGRLRVVVSTANLIEIDWRDIENTVWAQDVPLRSNPIAHDLKANDFPAKMAHIMRAVNVTPALITLVRNGHKDLPLKRVEELRSKWDFSKVKVQLVPSLAGKHEGWPKVIQTGHTALMKALLELGARPQNGQEVVLECQGSSIGTYSTQWTNEFYCSARGNSAEEWLDQPKARRAKLPYPPLKILFPTAKTVRESVLGERGGGTMFCRRNQWEGVKFPRELFYDSRSKRGRILMHSKMVIVTFRDTGLSKGKAVEESDSETEPETDDEIVEVKPKGPKVIGWAYVGSHNFTPSAWGTLSGSAFNPTISVTNFELGIVFPLKDENELEKVACWERPPKKYVRGKDEPWIQSESAFFAEE